MQILDNHTTHDVAAALEGENPDWSPELCSHETYRLMFDALADAVRGATDKDIAAIISEGGTFSAMRLALEDLTSSDPSP